MMIMLSPSLPPTHGSLRTCLQLISYILENQIATRRVRKDLFSELGFRLGASKGSREVQIQS